MNLSFHQREDGYSIQYVMQTAIVVVVVVLTTGQYFGSNEQWWLRKLLLFGMIRRDQFLPHLFLQWQFLFQHF